IQPGEKAVILAERKVEPDVIYGLWAAVQAKGGQAWACLVEPAHEGHVPSVVPGVPAEADAVCHPRVAAHSPEANRRGRAKPARRWPNGPLRGACARPASSAWGAPTPGAAAARRSWRRCRATWYAPAW